MVRISGVLKNWLNKGFNYPRHLMAAYVKEKQWRLNHSGQDLFLVFLQYWGAVETDLRNGLILKKDLETEVS